MIPRPDACGNGRKGRREGGDRAGREIGVSGIATPWRLPAVVVVVVVAAVAVFGVCWCCPRVGKSFYLYEVFFFLVSPSGFFVEVCVCNLFVVRLGFSFFSFCGNACKNQSFLVFPFYVVTLARNLIGGAAISGGDGEVEAGLNDFGYGYDQAHIR